MLKYTGKGRGDWLPEIPARDLSEEEVERCGGEEYLIGTGLYEKQQLKRKKATKPLKQGFSTPKEVKDARN